MLEPRPICTEDDFIHAGRVLATASTANILHVLYDFNTITEDPIPAPSRKLLSARNTISPAFPVFSSQLDIHPKSCTVKRALQEHRCIPGRTFTDYAGRLLLMHFPLCMQCKNMCSNTLAGRIDRSLNTDILQITQLLNRSREISFHKGVIVPADNYLEC